MDMERHNRELSRMRLERPERTNGRLTQDAWTGLVSLPPWEPKLDHIVDRRDNRDPEKEVYPHVAAELAAIRGKRNGSTGRQRGVDQIQAGEPS